MTSQNGMAGFDIPPSNEATVNGTGSLVSESSETTVSGTVLPQIQNEAPNDESLNQRIVELEAQAIKRENDYKALEGRLKSSTRETTQFDDLSEGLSMLTDTVNTFIRYQGTRDEEQFRQELQQVETNATSRKQTSNFERTAATMVDEIATTLRDAGFDPEEFIYSSPEMAEFRSLWGPNYDNQNLSGLYQAHSEFNRVVRQLEKDNHEKNVQSSVQKALEDHGVNTLDMDSSASAPASLAGNNLLTRLGDTNSTVSRDDIAKAAEAMHRQGIRF